MKCVALLLISFHTHSVNDVVCAQAGKDIPALGATHVDYFFGDIPCTRKLSEEEVKSAHELNTGRVIVETFKNNGIDPMAVSGCVTLNQGLFLGGGAIMHNLNISCFGNGEGRSDGQESTFC